MTLDTAPSHAPASPPMSNVEKAVTLVEHILQHPTQHSLSISGEEFSEDDLASVIKALAQSRAETFVYSHANQDPNVFVIVFQTVPQKFVTFPFHNAEQRKSLVASIIERDAPPSFESKGAS